MPKVKLCEYSSEVMEESDLRLCIFSLGDTELLILPAIYKLYKDDFIFC